MKQSYFKCYRFKFYKNWPSILQRLSFKPDLTHCCIFYTDDTSDAVAADEIVLVDGFYATIDLTKHEFTDDSIITFFAAKL